MISREIAYPMRCGPIISELDRDDLVFPLVSHQFFCCLLTAVVIAIAPLTEEPMRSIRSYFATRAAAAPSSDRRRAWRVMRACAALWGTESTHNPQPGLGK